MQFLEKTLTALAMPCGVCWLALGLAVWFAARRRQRLLSWLLAGIWILYTLAGNGLGGQWLLGRLEQPYYELKPLDAQPVDVLVVLGGTVGFLENGVAQVTSGGDRVVLAARMYHRGKARRLIAAGAMTTAAGFDEYGAGRATAQIWQDLGVPAADIAWVGGRNTSEEIRCLKEMLKEDALLAGNPALNHRGPPTTREPRRGSAIQNPKSKIRNPSRLPGPPHRAKGEKIGLLTSAWHMSRALRLAEQEGLDVIPVPADFLTSRQPASWDQVLIGLVPSGGGFRNTDRALKERLAAVVGR